MSVFGIRNALKDIGIRISVASADDLPKLYQKLTFVAAAIDDLRARYPRDTWLPKFELSLAQTFALLPYPQAQLKANDALDWIIENYPSTDQAFFADGMRRARLVTPKTMDVPIEPDLPSYAAPEH